MGTLYLHSLLEEEGESAQIYAALNPNDKTIWDEKVYKLYITFIL